MAIQLKTIFILFQTVGLYDLFHTDYTIRSSDLFTTQQIELALKTLDP